jgi:hypothetical protein
MHHLVSRGPLHRRPGWSPAASRPPPPLWPASQSRRPDPRDADTGDRTRWTGVASAASDAHSAPKEAQRTIKALLNTEG